jgi:mono/diheme cytochrome c family protein
MRRFMLIGSALVLGAGIAVAAESNAPRATPAIAQTQPPPAVSTSAPNSGFHAGENALDSAARAGREIWYKATAGNERFHTYTLEQRLGVLIDWFRVLNARERDDRFAAWGLINDPDCCVPGTEGCPARTLAQTYGLDFCPGDAELLKFVGKEGYRDPACDFREATPDPSDPHAKKGDPRQSSCDLAFGTSAGVLGFRKFPNPRFDPQRWAKKDAAGRSGWERFSAPLSGNPKNADARVSLLADGSVEPPFLVGIACGSCHIAFDPLNPPGNPAHPRWENINGAVGNQYSRISQILLSGMPSSSIEWQMFAHARPGTVDTSAVPTDLVNNPGTINAILNTDRRPTFAGEEIVKWRKTGACPKDAPEGECWCDPARDHKCWQRGKALERVHHILKGGEDSIGALEAIQRVYINIGSCAEQCWVNHLDDVRQLDPQSRNFGQTPFDIGQCRRDCPSFRAIEDRLPDILAFLSSKESDATDLARARQAVRRATAPRAVYTEADLERDLDKQFAPGSVERGREVFAERCARCHSSVSEAEAGPFKNRDFRAVADHHPRNLRKDWMGNDEAMLVSEIGTNRCRALHSNHMTNHVWQQYGSETLRARTPDPNLREPDDGGRGYYRNVSLLSVWAHAPLLHNNAVGPEICGKPANKANDFYRSPYVDAATGQSLPPGKAPACWTYDPSVEGRFKLFVASMEALLDPGSRVPKISKLSEDVPIPIGPHSRWCCPPAPT